MNSNSFSPSVFFSADYPGKLNMKNESTRCFVDSRIPILLKFSLDLGAYLPSA